MSIIGNKEIYSTLEFDSWANRENLIPAEKYLIEKYLERTKKTLEAGTGGGRILLAMKDLGFSSLYGFDYVPGFIEQARQRDVSHSINFEVQDATKLDYETSSFEQIIYLQQIISSIELDTARLNALKESHRILKKGGTALFSFLSFEVRSKSPLYLPYLIYLQILRKLRGSKLTIQSLPWLKLGGKFNLNSLIDKGPYVYWYKLTEISQILREVGFEIVAVGSSYQINQAKLCESYEILLNGHLEGMLYFVATK
jgi:ubiquinone/menaquinone biosynthesis C-methylase UbiE